MECFPFGDMFFVIGILLRRNGSRPAHPYHRAGIRVRCRAGDRSNMEGMRTLRKNAQRTLTSARHYQFARSNSTHMPFSSYAEADPPFHRLPSRRPTPHPIIPSTGKIKRRSQSSRRRSRITKAVAKRRRPTRSDKRSMPSGRKPRSNLMQCRILSVVLKITTSPTTNDEFELADDNNR